MAGMPAADLAAQALVLAGYALQPHVGPKARASLPTLAMDCIQVLDARGEVMNDVVSSWCYTAAWFAQASAMASTLRSSSGIFVTRGGGPSTIEVPPVNPQSLAHWRDAAAQRARQAAQPSLVQRQFSVLLAQQSRHIEPLLEEYMPRGAAVCIDVAFPAAQVAVELHGLTHWVLPPQAATAHARLVQAAKQQHALTAPVAQQLAEVPLQLNAPTAARAAALAAHGWAVVHVPLWLWVQCAGVHAPAQRVQLVQRILRAGQLR